MAFMIQQIVSLIVTVFLFTAIPLLYYIIKNRSLRGFVRNTGLYRSGQRNSKSIFFYIAAMYLFSFVVFLVTVHLGGTGLDVSNISELAPWEVFVYLILYGLKTGVSEEILFRGFIAKKLIGKLGFRLGNVWQAAIFSTAHIITLTMLMPLDIAARIIIALAYGWVFGFIMDKKASGSIIPCIAAHGIVNILSTTLFFFFR